MIQTCIVPSCDRTNIANKGVRNRTGSYQGLCGPCHKFFERRKSESTFEQILSEREKRLVLVSSLPDTCLVPSCDTKLTQYIKNEDQLCEPCSLNYRRDWKGTKQDYLQYRSKFLDKKPAQYLNSEYDILPRDKWLKKGDIAECRSCKVIKRIAHRKRNLCSTCSNSQCYVGLSCECCGKICQGKMNFHWFKKHSALVCHLCHARLGNYKTTISKLKELDIVKNCGICEIELTNDKSKTQRCIDHDHDTGRIRGVLCSLCNLTEGQIKSMQIGPAEYGRRLEKWMEKV